MIRRRFGWEKIIRGGGRRVNRLELFFEGGEVKVEAMAVLYSKYCW